MESLIVVAQAPTASMPEALEAVCGAEVAAELRRALLEDVAALAVAFRDSPMRSDANRKVIILGESAEAGPVVQLLEATGGRLVLAEGVDLGEAIRVAMRAEFDRGARAAAALFPDTPTLPLHVVDHTFRALLFHDLVLGPCPVGAPYLVGARRPLPPAAERVAWDLQTLLPTMVETLGFRKNLYLLPFWYRLAQPDSLELLRSHLQYLRERRPETAAATAAALAAIDGV